MSQILIRFLIGGVVVSAFAIVGDLLEPKSFAGLFGAAASVALATLGLTVATEGAYYVATECQRAKTFSLLPIILGEQSAFHFGASLHQF